MKRFLCLLMLVIGAMSCTVVDDDYAQDTSIVGTWVAEQKVNFVVATGTRTYRLTFNQDNTGSFYFNEPIDIDEETLQVVYVSQTLSISYQYDNLLGVLSMTVAGQTYESSAIITANKDRVVLHCGGELFTKVQ